MIRAILGDIVGSIYEFDNIKTKDFELFEKTAISYLDERHFGIVKRFNRKYLL